MDERDMVRSIISHINSARSEIDLFLMRSTAPNSRNELEQASSSLVDSIKHCQAIFGPTTIRDRRRL
ncbi:MAG: hypothetical protein ABFD08_15995 [Syntrophomonas sp.]